MSKRFQQLVVATLFSLIASSTSAGEPLKIFILAGQSNMVGHARAHTIATLLASNNTRDQALVQSVLGQDRVVSQTTLENQ